VVIAHLESETQVDVDVAHVVVEGLEGIPKSFTDCTEHGTGLARASTGYWTVNVGSLLLSMDK